MTLLTRLFRKAPSAPSPTPASPAQKQPSSAAETVGDGGAAVRSAAVSRLPDGEALRALVRDGSSREAQRAAQTRLAELIDAGAVDFNDFCSQTPDHAVMLAVAAACKDPARIKEAIARIGDSKQIAELALKGRSTIVRQLAAEWIEDPSQLRALLKQVRGKDNNVYRILKHKVDALNAAERSAAELREELQSVCASLERHASRGFEIHYASTLEHLCGRWRSVAAQPDADTQRRVDRAIERCRAVIAEHERLASQQAAERAARQAADEARHRAAQEAAQAAAAEAAILDERRREADAVKAAEEAERARKIAAQEQLHRQIGGLIRKAHEAIGEGVTQKAAGLRRAIEAKRGGAPELAPHLIRGLAQLDEKLEELKQWKDYAVGPKRVALIEAMESLIGAKESPQKLADRIKSLQRQWRTISQGIVSEASADWERFHRASQAAYQPCSEYFAAQAALRQRNLEARQALLERLLAFESSHDAENPDWRLIARVLREAPQEWRRYFPVEREPGRAAQAQFDEAMSRIEARLDDWHRGNDEAKEALIKRARHALATEDGREAIEAVKGLQGQWKDSGPAAREREQTLWNEFREVCDAVYQKRHQAFAEYSAGLDANKGRAAELCVEVEQAAGRTGPALLECAAKLTEWSDAFESIGEMPRADARGLNERFERAIARLRDQLAAQRRLDAEQSVLRLFEAGRHVHAYRWAAASNADAAECETLRKGAEDFIAGAAQWPKGALQTLKEALTQTGAVAGGVKTDADPETARRMLCVRAEILSEMPSPPEDETIRREHQVKRLMQGMGQGVKDDDWDSLTLAWLRAGAVAPELYQRLERRLLDARAHRVERAAEPAYFHQDSPARNTRRRDRPAGGR